MAIYKLVSPGISSFQTVRPREADTTLAQVGTFASTRAGIDTSATRDERTHTTR
jgi:hypothetical protein